MTKPAREQVQQLVQKEAANCEAALLLALQPRHQPLAAPKLYGVAIYQRFSAFPGRIIVGANQIDALLDMPILAYEVSLIIRHLAASVAATDGTYQALIPGSLARNFDRRTTEGLGAELVPHLSKLRNADN